jgi:uncharacterized protein (DUF2235 family)
MMRRAMAKNIILCSDGTGNADIKGRGTNVFKLFEAVDLNEYRTNPELEAQLAFYDDGVGAKGSMMMRAMGNATGYGLAANVKQLYRELSRVYDAGDKIFLFGFSRGAFTVRTLADMIGKCGVLKGESFETATELRKAVDAAYRAYRAYYDSQLTKAVVRLTGGSDGPTRVREYQETYEPHADVTIRFVGVWDTVDAVGLPFAIADTVNTLIYQFKFPDRLLGAHVLHACQALSLDDDRRAFEPVLWEVREGDQRIEQVWFAGVHSNVGGGYPKQGMSLVALDWMLAHAETHELRLQPLDNQMFRGHASVDDMMYNPRAGLGLFYRWAPRDVRAYCDRSGIRHPRIHLTVAERIAHGTDDYALWLWPGGRCGCGRAGAGRADGSDNRLLRLTHDTALMLPIVRDGGGDPRRLRDRVDRHGTRRQRRRRQLRVQSSRETRRLRVSRGPRDDGAGETYHREALRQRAEVVVLERLLDRRPPGSEGSAEVSG